MFDPIPPEELSSLIEQVDSFGPLKVPTKMKAFKLSLAKWHPSRGVDRGTSKHMRGFESCGLCVRYRKVSNSEFKSGCGECPLNRAGVRCTSYNSIFEEWVMRRNWEGQNVDKAAEAMYQLILENYKSWLEECKDAE